MRQTTKEKQRQWRWAHRRSCRLDWNNVLGPVPSELLSCVSPPTVSVTTIYFLLHFSFLFFFLRPHYGFYYLLFDFDASPGVSYFSHSFNIFRGRHLFACLFVCLFLPKINSRIDSAFRFDMVRQSETSIYYGVNFYYKNKTKNTKTKKELVLLDWYRGEPGIMGYSSDRICCWRAVSWVGWVWFLDGWWTFVLVFLACLLARVLGFLIESACCAAAVFRFGDLASHLSAISSFRTYIPWSRYYLRYSCSIPTYLILHIIISPYHLIWCGMIMDSALSTFACNRSWVCSY